MSAPTIVVQARMSSTRFPGKVLADLHGAPMLIRILERLDAVQGTTVLVATSDDPGDDAVASVVEAAGRACYRGPLDDVLTRYLGAARAVDADPIVRITGDCPFADPGLIAGMLERYELERREHPELALLTNVRPPTYPDGLDVEIVGRAALERAAEECQDPRHREHVLLHLHEHPERYQHLPFTAAHDRAGERWTIDYPADLEFARAVYAELYPRVGPGFGMAEIHELLARAPQLAALRAPARRNEGLVRPD